MCLICIQNTTKTNNVGVKKSDIYDKNKKKRMTVLKRSNKHGMKRKKPEIAHFIKNFDIGIIDQC